MEKIARALLTLMGEISNALRRIAKAHSLQADSMARIADVLEQWWDEDREEESDPRTRSRS